MKLILFFIAMINTSWQQESTETLNETLDRLIKQANFEDRSKIIITSHPDSTKNTSRIIYVNQPETKTTSNKGNQNNEPINNTGDNAQHYLINALNLKVSESEDDNSNKSDKSYVSFHSFKENTASESAVSDTDTETDTMLQDLLEKLMSKSKNIGKSGDQVYLSSERNDIDGNELIPNYPEIIINKITYHEQNGNKTKGNHEALGAKNQQNKQENASSQKMIDSSVVSQELKALLNEIQSLKTTETTTEMISQRSHIPSQMSQIQDTQIKNQPCNNMLYPSPCSRAAMLDNYSNSNTNFVRKHFNLFGPQNLRQIEFIRIARAQKLKRIQFITQLMNNMMSKFVYRPLYVF